MLVDGDSVGFGDGVNVGLSDGVSDTAGVGDDSMETNGVALGFGVRSKKFCCQKFQPL